MKKNGEIRVAVRYSEAFKMQVVRELETGTINIDQVRRKYGVAACASIRSWLRKYGNGSVGKVMRVETPQEQNEQEQMKRRIKALEKALADTNIDLALERQYTRLACERAGIQDVVEFKKKAAGRLPMGR